MFVNSVKCELSLPTSPIDNVKRALSPLGLSSDQEVRMVNLALIGNIF